MADNDDFKVNDQRVDTREEPVKVTDRRPNFDEDEAAPTAGANTEEGCGCQANQAHEDGKARAGCPMPEVSFSTFILSLASSAMVHLGEAPEPESEQTVLNLPLAKHTIDILAMLKDKTAKCLTEDETRLMDAVLYELRMHYVKKAG